MRCAPGAKSVVYVCVVDVKMGGHVVFTFDVGGGGGGGGVRRVAETRHTFNDGQYHSVQFTRTGSTATLSVDNLPSKHTDSDSSGSPSLSCSLTHQITKGVPEYHKIRQGIFILFDDQRNE